MVDPLSYFSFQPVFYNWCNSGRGIYYAVYGILHINDPFLPIGRVALEVATAGFFFRYVSGP